jgi:superfamily II RNA helicase
MAPVTTSVEQPVRPVHPHPLADAALAEGAPTDPDGLYAAFTGWAAGQGLTLYPHQDEAVIEWCTGRHVVLSTPTGSGKSLVATAAHFAALAADEVSFYTAPIKALVNEKFFALCEVFGAENVGLLTGDASVNPDAPIITCTAEVLANIALREGAAADVGTVVMDEFHYYADPQRGWAWQVPLLELTGARFLLMSATLGDTSRITADLRRRTGREVAEVTSAERPVPLTYSWSLTPLPDMVDELVTTHRAPVYVVHPSQAAATEQAKSLRGIPLDRERKAALADRLAPVRFGPGFGRTLSALLRRGVGVHHAGMLPRYRRTVEQLAQAGLLTVVCGTDTLGVGINVPIRTVLMTRLTKFDGQRERLLKAREFHQVAGRAGRAGYDTSGEVVVQAPDHVIENERLLAKAGEDPKKRRRVQRRTPPEGTIVWTHATFERLVAAPPEPLVSRMRVDDAMILGVVARPGDPVRALSRLLRGSHEDAAGRARLARRAIRLARSLLDSGVLVRLPEPDADGRTVALTVDLPEDFALHQPLSQFALAALDLLDPAADTHALDVVSVVEAVLDDPRPVLLAQQWEARGEAVAEMKADGVEYEERMERLEEVTWPRPLAELLEPAYETYRHTHPWLPLDGLSPKSVVRRMWEQGMGFTDLVGRYTLARSEGVVLRYLSDVYRTLRQTVPDTSRTPALAELEEWLGETIRQTDSSLLDEWEALTDPESVRAAAAAHAEPPRPPRPVTANERAFGAMVRQAMWRRVDLASRDDVDGLYAVCRAVAELPDPPRPVVATREAWDDGLGAYWAEHDDIGTGPNARGPALFQVTPGRAEVPGVEDLGERRVWVVRQVLDDPAGDHDWAIGAVVDLDASDEAGEPVLVDTGLARL